MKKLSTVPHTENLNYSIATFHIFQRKNLQKDTYYEFRNATFVNFMAVPPKRTILRYNDKEDEEICFVLRLYGKNWAMMKLQPTLKANNREKSSLKSRVVHLLYLFIMYEKQVDELSKMNQTLSGLLGDTE